MGRVDVRAIRRKQILAAAERLAVERGWAEITILDICQEAGISSGVLTYHFQNKDELLFTLLEEFIARIDAHLNKAMREQQTPEADVNNFLQNLMALLESEPQFPALLIHFVAASLHRPEIAARLHTLFATIRQRKVKELITTISTEDDLAVMVSMLHIVGLGMVLGRPFMGIELPRERLIQEARRVLLACIPVPEIDAQENRKGI